MSCTTGEGLSCILEVAIPSRFVCCFVAGVCVSSLTGKSGPTGAVARRRAAKQSPSLVCGCHRTGGKQQRPTENRALLTPSKVNSETPVSHSSRLSSSSRAPSALKGRLQGPRERATAPSFPCINPWRVLTGTAWTLFVQPPYGGGVPIRPTPPHYDLGN